MDRFSLALTTVLTVVARSLTCTFHDTAEYVFDVTSVGQCSSPWTCNSVKVEIKFHLECKLHFPSVQLILRQIHLTKVFESIEAKYWVSWLSFDVQQAWMRAVKTALNSSFCAVTADSKSRWPHWQKTGVNTVWLCDLPGESRLQEDCCAWVTFRIPMRPPVVIFRVIEGTSSNETERTNNEWVLKVCKGTALWPLPWGTFRKRKRCRDVTCCPSLTSSLLVPSPMLIFR